MKADSIAASILTVFLAVSSCGAQVGAEPKSVSQSSASRASAISASARQKLADGSEISVTARGNADEGLKALEITMLLGAGAASPISAIVILTPPSGGGNSVQVKLTPAAEPGKTATWDVSSQVAAAIKGGKLDAGLEPGSRLMVQLLKGKKGEAVGAPMGMSWGPVEIAPPIADLEDE